MTDERYYVLFMVDSSMGDKRCKLWGSEERYKVLFMVDSCMGDKRNTQDINCGGLRKDTTFYSWLTVVWETKEIHKI